VGEKYMDDGFLVVELGFDCQQSGYNLLSANTPQEVNASYEHHTLFRYVMSPPFAYGI